MAKFKVITFTGNAKYTYVVSRPNIIAAIDSFHSDRLDIRVIEVKEMGVRFTKPDAWRRQKVDR